MTEQAIKIKKETMKKYREEHKEQYKQYQKKYLKSKRLGGKETLKK